MSNNKKSSIDVLWNAIPDEAKLNMPFGTYEIVSRLFEEEIKDAFNAGDCNGTFETINRQQYYNQTYGDNTEQ